MKKKSLPVLLAASLLALSAGACGTENAAPSEQEQLDISSIDGEAAADTEDSSSKNEIADSPENQDVEESPQDSDTNVTSNHTDESGIPSRVSVTADETHNEIKADDGTVLLTSDVSMPVVSIEGAEDAAAKINADIADYYAVFSSSDEETVSMARSDYEASQADENGGWFHGYGQSASFRVTRMDDKVLSLELTVYSDTGGAHGNYGSVGKNYDLRTGNLIGLMDLSADYEAFHATALDYMVNLAQTPAYKDRLFEPSKADLDSALFDGENWTFTLSGISFFADPYALGPYASGEIYFRLPYEKAYDLGLKEDYHYNGNFMEERYYTSPYDPDTMELLIDKAPEYSFDLNGDGTQEGLALYGLVVNPDDGSQSYAYYIDGTDWGQVVKEQLGELEKNGYLDTTYVLYDMDPSDGMTEIGLLFTDFSSDPEAEYESREYTYLFRYTKDDELQFLERRDGFISRPPQSS